ncbi:MAG: GC-type dockerin domain-anchored protein [Planctomycetota bacterium]
MSYVNRWATAGVIATTSALALAGGTLTSGDATFDLLFSPVFNAPFGDANLIPDAGGTDELSKFTWYYRTPNNNQNRFFSSLDTPTESYVGDTATIGYTNAGPGVAGFERFDADFTVRLEDGPGAGAARVITDLVVTNVSMQTNTFQFFHLVDMDLSQTVSDDTAVNVSPLGSINRAEDPGSFAEHIGLGADRFEVNAGSVLRNKLDGGSFNLNNDLNPFTGDAASAFQWTLTLAPGESASIRSIYAIGRSASDSCATADITVDAACLPGVGDGVVNLSDFSCYLSQWAASAPLADITTDGVCTPGSGGDGVTLSDFSCYLSLWSGGCDGDPGTPL